MIYCVPVTRREYPQRFIVFRRTSFCYFTLSTHINNIYWSPHLPKNVSFALNLWRLESHCLCLLCCWCLHLVPRALKYMLALNANATFVPRPNLWLATNANARNGLASSSARHRVVSLTRGAKRAKASARIAIAVSISDIERLAVLTGCSRSQESTYFFQRFSIALERCNSSAMVRRAPDVRLG